MNINIAVTTELGKRGWKLTCPTRECPERKKKNRYAKKGELLYYSELGYCWCAFECASEYCQRNLHSNAVIGVP
jgi:hypothetical protein